MCRWACFGLWELFSRMRSEGLSFYFWGLGWTRVGPTLLLCSQPLVSGNHGVLIEVITFSAQSLRRAMSMPTVDQTHLRAWLEQSILIALASMGPSARHDTLLVIGRICSKVAALLAPLRGFHFEAVQDVFTGLGLWIAHGGYDLVECSAELLQIEAAKASQQAKPCRCCGIAIS